MRVLAPGRRCRVSRPVATLKPSIPKHRKTLMAKRKPAHDAKYLSTIRRGYEDGQEQPRQCRTLLQRASVGG